MRVRPQLFIASLSALCFTWCSHAGAEDLIVRIGQVSPLTGNIAHLGKDAENGVRMALDEANARGIVIAGRKIQFLLASEDDAAEPRQATMAAQKLVDLKVQGIIGHLTSGTSIPASKIYSDAGIAQISPSATNPKYTKQGFKTTFRVVANDAQLGSVMGRYAAQDLKIKTVAVIDDRSAYGQGLADEFLKSAKASGISIVSRQFTTEKSTEFGAILTAIKSKNPDAIFFGGIDAVGGPLLRKMKQLGITAKFLGGDGICTEQMPILAGDGLTDNTVLCAEPGGVERTQQAAMEDFRKKFKIKFTIPVQIYAPYAYDATMLMIAAMQKAGSVDPSRYIPALANTPYQGVTGLVEFDANGDRKNSVLTLYTFREKKRVQLAVIQ